VAVRKTESSILGVFALTCLLLAAGMVGCGLRAESPYTPSQSSGGLVEKLTIEELTVRADSILVGEVADIASYQEGEGNIYTVVTLSVEQTIKGEAAGQMTIKVTGGEVDGLGLWVEDVPSFEPEEKVVVFLEEIEGAFGVCGWHQGKFTIDKNNMVSGNTPLTEFTQQIRNILASQ